MNIQELHEGIANSLEKQNLEDTKGLYKQYMRHYAARALRPDIQLKIADIFYNDQEYNTAAEALERYLRFYPEGSRVDRALIKLGFIYSRHLRFYGTAKRYLSWAIQTAQDRELSQKAEAELKLIEEYLAKTEVSELKGPCAIIRQTEDPVDVSFVGKIVSPIIGVPFTDITSLLRSSRGFVAMNVPPDKARIAADALQSKKIPVLIIPSELLVGLPPAQIVVAAAFNSEGGYFQDTKGEPSFYPWSNIYMTVAGEVTVGKKDIPVSTIVEDARDLLSILGPISMTGTHIMYPGAVNDGEKIGETYRKILHPKEKISIFLDVLIYKPWRRYRVMSYFFNYTLIQKYSPLREQSMGFYTLCQNILQFSKDVKENKAVEAIAYKKDLKDYKFDSENEFNLYVSWILQLEEWGLGRLEE